MPGLGTIVNVTTVIVGGIIGCFLHGGLKKRFQEILMQALGLATLFIGLAGALKGLLTITDSSLDTKGVMPLIGSLVLGALVGECINIEKRIETFGDWLKKKAKSTSDPQFTEGFVSCTLVICVGAMAVVGSLEDGLSQNTDMLFTKAILDFIIVLIMASTLGKGVIFSFLPLAVFQGLITIFSQFLAPILTDNAIHTLSFVGSTLIFCVGINLAFGKKFKVGNLLPALLFAVLVGILNL